MTQSVVRTKPEIWFYQLQRETLESAIVPLLEKTLQRGWKAIVRTASAERASAIDSHLWTWRPDSFLPHGRSEDGHTNRQPIYLTEHDDNPNNAEVLFLVDGISGLDWNAPALKAHERVVLIFDGRSEDALSAARMDWRNARDAALAVTYWKQSDDGRWEKQD